MNEVFVNKEQSRAIGQIVGQLKLKPEFLKRDFLTIDLKDEIKASMYYYAVGICHQTYHLANPKLQLYGWDFLEYGFIQLAKEKPELLDASFITTHSSRDLIELIKPYFAIDNQAENCTLDRLDERIRLWKNMARFLLSLATNTLDFIKSADHKPEYFYENLKNTEAYSDPFQKKTSFLMKIFEDAKLVQFSDTQNIIPIMDYHMQRVLLRTGCVEIQDKELYEKLVQKVKVKEDDSIRNACIESMKIIAETSGYSVLKMNDIFYTMGRSCCNENPLCITHSCEKSPCTLSLAVDIPEKHTCIFENSCKGAKDKKYRAYWQPIVETHFY